MGLTIPKDGPTWVLLAFISTLIVHTYGKFILWCFWSEQTISIILTKLKEMEILGLNFRAGLEGAPIDMYLTTS